MISRVRYWDLAGTTDGAFTAGVRMSTKGGLYYIEDVVRGQWTPHHRDRVVLQTAIADAELFNSKSSVKIYIEQEPGSSGLSVVQTLIKLLAGFPVYGDRPTGDKDTRLIPFASQAEAGNVLLVQGKWNHAWLEEMTAIPNGTYRDQGDATAGAFNKLALKKSSGAKFTSRGLYSSQR